jgi:hypothetical protein
LTSSTQAERIGMVIAAAATPALRILDVGGPAWKRNVPENDGRHGPWLPASWQVLNEKIWTRRTGTLYLVMGLDGFIRYVGISRNRVADRWRLSPAVDAETMQPLLSKQLFHSQCWPHLQRERGTYEVRAISGDELVPVLERLGPPVSGFTALRGDSESIAASVERWLCNHQSERLVSWNTAMTAKRKA